GRLDDVVTLLLNRPDGRARRVGVGRVRNPEAPARPALRGDRVRVELQFQEPLAADLLRVRVLDCAAEPERRPDARYRERTVFRQDGAPRYVLRGARCGRDGIELRLVVTRAARRVDVIPVLALAADDVRETAVGAVRARASRGDSS